MNKLTLKLVILILGIATAMDTLQAQGPVSVTNRGLDPELSSKIEDFAQEGMKKWHAPGLAIGIVKGDQLVWTGYFGYANIEKKQPVAEGTVFRIGSISKTFTAVAMMQLMEQGKFKVDDPVDNYSPYPIFKQKKSCCAPPTFMNVFTHTSGGGEYKSIWQLFSIEDPALWVPQGKPRPSFAQIYRHGIETKICPGDKWAYCNYCVGALGPVLENMTGQSFQDYTDKHIFKPLGMDSSSFYETDAILANIAQGYNFGKDKFQAIDLVMLDAVPAGNIYTTVNDISRYMIAMLNGGKLGDFSLLQPQTVDYMFEPHYQVDERGGKIGINFLESDSYFGHRVAGHGGGLPGFTSDLRLAVDDKLGVVVLNNAGSSAPAEISAGILKILFNYSEPEKIEPTKEIWPKLTGRYISPEPDLLTDARFLQSSLGAYRICVRKGKLYFETNKIGERYELRQVNKDDPYFYKIVMKDNLIPQYMVFKPGPDGKAKSLVLGLNEYVRHGEPRAKPCAK